MSSGNESEGLTEAEALGEELIDAVRGHDDSTVRELLVLGADPNMRVETERGTRSILTEAIAENHAPCVVVLIEGGANVNEGDAGWVTPLKVVVGQNYATLVEPICKAGINRDILDTSLVMACKLGSKESAFMLLKCGADPANLTVLGDESRTALHNCSAKDDDDGFEKMQYTLREANECFLFNANNLWKDPSGNAIYGGMTWVLSPETTKGRLIVAPGDTGFVYAMTEGGGYGGIDVPFPGFGTEDHWYHLLAFHVALLNVNDRFSNDDAPASPVLYSSTCALAMLPRRWWPAPALN